MTSLKSRSRGVSPGERGEGGVAFLPMWCKILRMPVGPDKIQRLITFRKVDLMILELLGKAGKSNVQRIIDSLVQDHLQRVVPEVKSLLESACKKD